MFKIGDRIRRKEKCLHDWNWTQLAPGRGIDPRQTLTVARNNGGELSFFETSVKTSFCDLFELVENKHEKLMEKLCAHTE